MRTNRRSCLCFFALRFSPTIANRIEDQTVAVDRYNFFVSQEMKRRPPGQIAITEEPILAAVSSELGLINIFDTRRRSKNSCFQNIALWGYCNY
jgi:hypothetical protein